MPKTGGSCLIPRFPWILSRGRTPLLGVVGMGWGRGEGRDEKNLLEMETSQ